MIAIIYLIGTIDGLIMFFSLTAAALLIASLVMIICYLMEDEYYYGSKEEIKKYKKITIKLAIIALVPLFLAVALPNSKTLSAMILLPKLAENKQLQNIPKKTLKILNLKLDEYIKETTKKYKKE